MNSDTIQTLARFLLKLLTGALVAHGAQHITDATVQAGLEELLATGLGALSLWWSSKHQKAIAASGSTQTFSKSDLPGIPPTPPAPPKP